MVANSPVSVQPGKTNTGKTGGLMPEMALEIFQEAARKCQQSGIDVNVLAIEGERVAVVLANVQYDAGNLVWEGDK